MKSIYMKNILFIFLFFLTNVLFAQNCSGFDNFPLGEDKALELYDSLKNECSNKNYENALKIWEQLYVYSPVGDEKLYSYGVELYTSFINDKRNDGKTNLNYEEEIINIYENYLTCLSPKLGDSGKVLEAMAFSLSEISYPDNLKTLETYQKVIDTNGNQTSAWILPYYADHVLWMFGEDLLDKKTARETYLQLEKIKDANTDNPKYAEMWKYVEEYYDEYTIDYAFDCEFLEKIYRPEFESNPTNKTKIKKIIESLKWSNCDESDFAKELKAALKN